MYGCMQHQFKLDIYLKYLFKDDNCVNLYIKFLLQIQHFLQFVRSIYQSLPEHMSKIFEPKPQIRVKELSEVNTESLLEETYTCTVINVEKKMPDGTNSTEQVRYSFCLVQIEKNNLLAVLIELCTIRKT